MSNITNFAEKAPILPFTEYDFYELYREMFEQSELGRIKRLLPLHELATSCGLMGESLRPKRGKRSYFTPERKVALMFLKMKTQLSFPKLLEQLNGNVRFQIFCDVLIDPLRPLTNNKLLDDIAAELAGKMKIQELQEQLAKAWKPWMKDLDTMYTDATCYESEMRYPTDQKLLWEGIEKAYAMMCRMSECLGNHRPRTKYLDVEKANLTYRKQRRHSKGQTKMYRQQKNHFRSGDARESIPDRIVSISKPYVRPIVRGKEAKNVEFGAKSNNILVDGLSFIEKLSFNAFSEGTRLKHCITLHKRLFGVDVKKIGGDTGYAGTDNRDHCKANDIQTSFTKRGRPSAEKKEHYDLKRVKARKKAPHGERGESGRKAVGDRIGWSRKYAHKQGLPAGSPRRDDQNKSRIRARSSAKTKQRIKR